MEKSGFSIEEFPRTWEALRSVADGSVAPGLVLGLWREKDPDRILIAAQGSTRHPPAAAPITPDTSFDLASVSKVFATASLAAVLVDRRWISWDTRLQAIFPAYPLSDVTLGHLLSHTAGYPAWEPLWQKLRAMNEPTALHRIDVEERQQQMRQLVFEVKPEAPPQSRALYSDISFLLLGFALEEVLQLPLDQAVRRHVWEPLGLSDSLYRRILRSPGEDVHPEVAATEDCPWRGGVLQGQVHDDNCWAMGGYGGHAGAFAPVHDVLAFSKGWFTGFVSAETRARAWTPVPSPPGCSRTLGWDTPSGAEPSASSLFSPRSVGHLGFTGTSLWIDPEARLAVSLLTNRVHPGRENILIRAFRPRIHRAIREDLAALNR